ncbi:DUF1934 domain-containing protein [Lederbergia graminis]|uniref:DUF1934 domain-containing protein n=1 Tax=Lederbergia graminis TaxID=735518 RepID=A0ABW0LNA7_9BACI
MMVETQTPVKIHLKNKIQVDDEAETYELTLFGTHYRKKNAIYLKYDEVQDEGTVHTIVKITNDEAVIIRSGIIKMRLSFQLSQERNGSHESGFGHLFLTTKTKRLQHTEQNNECEGALHLAYELAMEGTVAGYYEMDIHYEEDMVKK